MGRFTAYIMFMTVTMIVFYFGGLIDGTVNSTLLDIALDPTNIKETVLANQLGTAIAAVATAATIIIGFVTGQVEYAAAFILGSYIIGLGWDFLTVVSVLYAENGVIAIILFSPILIGYIMTAFEFWRGRD